MPDVNMMGEVLIADYYRTTGTALYFASCGGNIDVVAWLLKQPGIDLSLGGTRTLIYDYEISHSPLEIACYNHHISVVKALVAAGADVNEKNDKGCTPLMSARSCPIIQYLIENGADVNARSNSGKTILDLKFKDKNQRFFLSPGSHSLIQLPITTLLTYGALPGMGTALPPLHTRLVHSTGAPLEPLVGLLLGERAKPGRGGLEPLVGRGGLEPFALSLGEKTAEVLSQTDVFYRTALHYAALVGNHMAYDMLRTAMLRVGVDPDAMDAGSKTASDYYVRIYLLLYYF
jgi:hypothetical protein